MEHRAWFALSIDDVEQVFKTNRETGLSSDEATLRLISDGPNRLPEPVGDSFLKQVVRQFASPIVLMLVVATPAAAFVGTGADALVIAIALLLNVGIGVFQEGRASRAFEALRTGAAKHGTVLRDGMPKEVDAEELVTGDIVLLSAGAAIPADVRLVEVHGLIANEAALSGEWVPVRKNVREVPRGAVLPERVDMAYAGTLVVGGAGKGIVVAIGSQTQFGTIATSLREGRTPETPLARDLRRAGSFLLGIATAIIVVVFLLALHDGIGLREALLFAIAIAVSSVPEGLPAAVTVALALGMERILKKGGLVKNLRAAEVLGATSVIITDKTGTLTEGRMRIVGFATLSGTTEDLTGTEARRMLRAAVLASDGYIEERAEESEGDEEVVVHGRPMEQTIVLTGFTAGLSSLELHKKFPRLDELPFDAERRFGGMLVEESGHAFAYLSGAPELLIEHARRAHDSSGGHSFSAHEAAFMEEALRRAARASERVVGIARVPWSEKVFPVDGNYDALLDRAELLGFLIFSDTVRLDAKQAVADIRAAGARVIMATGDNPDTALAIARATGIAGSRTRAHIGTELEKLSDSELYTLVMEHAVFARVAPKDKLRIANVLTGNGEVVAMTGDGVNDAPALQAAAIGVAIGSGTEVAKEAADLVLLHDSFSVITSAIAEGRRLRDNVKKIFAYLVATNFGETFVLVSAFAFGLPLPLLPTQILWSNLVNGGPMNVAFAFEPLYPSAMKRKPKDEENAKILSRPTLNLILLVGLMTGMLLIGVFLFLIHFGLPEAEMRTMMFVAVSFDSMFTALSLKSFGTPLWRIPLLSNLFLLAALAASALVLGAALYIPPVMAIVHTVPLALTDILILALVGVVDLVLVEAVKFFIFVRPEEQTKPALV